MQLTFRTLHRRALGALLALEARRLLAVLRGRPDLLRLTQEAGVNIVPATFYANTPTLADIETSFEYKGDEPPYLNPDVFDPDRMKTWLADLIPYARDFQPPADFWNNGQFSFSDASCYYAMLRLLRPWHVVEIGSGFSTQVALRAIEDNGAGDITCIEPFPRPFLRLMPIDLRELRAQDVTDLNLLLQDGDVLFIDSTHTVKTGSDCMHIYLRLLPKVRKRIYLHVHDVFLPFGIPREWAEKLHIHWTEQHLLFAWLLDNPRAKVLYGSAYHGHFNSDLLESLMHGRHRPGGSSIWIEYDGRRA